MVMIKKIINSKINDQTEEKKSFCFIFNAMYTMQHKIWNRNKTEKKECDRIEVI